MISFAEGPVDESDIYSFDDRCNIVPYVAEPSGTR
jgi:hypothetical protein